MQRREVTEQLKQYIAQKILDGKDIGLDETTPLLEWGILNSIEIARLLSFLNKQMGVNIPMEQMTADHFTNLSTITDLVIQTAQ